MTGDVEPLPYRRKETIGACTLYLANSVELLPYIGVVDHCITDPPYGVDVYLRMRNPDSAGGNRMHKIKGGDSITAMKKGAIGDLGDLYEPVSRYCGEYVKRWAVIFSDVESIHLWRHGLQDAGMRYARTGAWIKPDAMPQMTGDRPAVGFEPCTIAHAQGRMRWNRGGKQAIWVHNIVKGENRPDHPCPKPFGLMSDLVKDFTDRGETIIDPFLGSGTTGAACAALGRKFIGIEIDEGWYRGACERIRKVYNDGMFSQAPTPMLQESLL
jgi:site-specific DNA-methyltransferase (adenine-specific)